jgi:Ca-activated chloride channel family protein
MYNYEFVNPEFLWLLVAIPIIALWFYWRRKDSYPEMRFPDASFLAQSKFNRSALLHVLPRVLRILSIALVIVALARPRSSEEKSKSSSTEGIDIMLAVDVSVSMLSQDLKPNRLEATKEVATDFIEGRSSDRIGLVVYSGESYTQTPLTTDHAILKNDLSSLRSGLIDPGTAIGMGLATTINRLKDSKAKSKVAILLTDGENNVGEIDPLTAAEWAKTFNIRVYTIGVGTKGRALTVVGKRGANNYDYAYLPVNIDEKLLKEIAKRTDGQYFRATDNQKLAEIYKEIDQLEKTKLQELRFYTYDEKFDVFALWALGLLFVEVLLRYTLLKSFV